MLGARFEAGAEVVAREVGLDAALDGANWLITGEGRSDVQTLHGKAPFIACQHARAHDVAASLLSGAIDPAALPRLSEHFSGCFSPAPARSRWRSRSATPQRCWQTKPNNLRG